MGRRIGSLVRGEGGVKRAYKPDSVPRRERRAAAISLVPPSPAGSCSLPGDSGRAPRSAPESGVRPSIWPCSERGLPAFRLAPESGALLPHLFTLACASREREAIGDLVSVALSVASLRLGVTQRSARRSPDFPPRREAGAAARPS